MKQKLQKAVIICFAIGLFFYFLFMSFSGKIEKEEVEYGTTFSVMYAQELGIDWKEAFSATLDDLNIKSIRIPLYWESIESQKGQFDFSDIDWMLVELSKRDGKAILAVGKRLPRWPECHLPKWSSELNTEDLKEAQKDYVGKVVGRYRNSNVVKYWQVENEPFLTAYASQNCGIDADQKLLDELTGIVRNVDRDTPIMITDSGNYGLWKDAYKRADVFGYSVYQYVYNDWFGEIKSWLPASYYRLKIFLVNSLFNDSKPTILSELSLEPWLSQPIVSAPLELSASRMNAQRAEEVLAFALGTGERQQYLWGVEWWYWLKTKHNDDSMWKVVKNWVNN